MQSIGRCDCLTLEKRYVILVALTIAFNLIAAIVSWYAVTGADAYEMNPIATFTPLGFFARILAILTVSSMFLTKSEARRNIMMGMLLGGVSADAIWDLMELNAISYSLQYFAWVGMIATAAVVPTFVALVEVGRLTRQRGQSEPAR